jgi:hypothetical protein
MAGSYNHVVANDGNLGSNEWVVDMLENGGDVYEAVEEMFGMIWYLAGHVVPAAPVSEIKNMVEAARRNYKEGLSLSKEIHDQYPDRRRE